MTPLQRLVAPTVLKQDRIQPVDLSAQIRVNLTVLSTPSVCQQLRDRMLCYRVCRPGLSPGWCSSTRGITAPKKMRRYEAGWPSWRTSNNPASETHLQLSQRSLGPNCRHRTVEFDFVNHRRPGQNLNGRGVHSQLISGIKSFLAGRTYRVKVGISH